MSSEIRKIEFIKNMAIFKNFNWNNSVRDSGNNVEKFKKINILYGRNYSGKTTLSRIFRALETGKISEKYDSPEFKLIFDDCSIVTEKSLTNHNNVVRVFNEDFVRENLRFINDEEQNINSFAILGENNTKIEQEIKKNENELGNLENKCGKLWALQEADKVYMEAEKRYSKKNNELEAKLRDKANNREYGIKHNKDYGEANYNVNKLKSDIKMVIGDTNYSLSVEQRNEYLSLLREESKSIIPEIPILNLKYSTIELKAKELIEKKVQVSNPIQELLNDAILSKWVRDGRDYHKGKREKCAFCGNELPKDLWDKLDKHFNKESEELRNSLNDLNNLINQEILQSQNLLKVKKDNFYSNFKTDLESLETNFLSFSKSYYESLNSIKEQVERRINDIFMPYDFLSPQSVENDLNNVRDSFEDLRNKSNDFTASLSEKQFTVRQKLRLHNVYIFIKEIDYENEIRTIQDLDTCKNNAQNDKDIIQRDVDKLFEKIANLKAHLKDESKGADRVNYFLNNFFGNQYISLKAIEENPNDVSSGYRFEVTRDNTKAFLLSEGECSLIAFCYFMAKLEDIDTKDTQPIIWIDDPISSLDENHIFFVFSLINSEIANLEIYDENGESKTRERFKQLFISTHNLNFLKYLKRLKGATKKESQYFSIIRMNQISDIKVMPKHLKEYVTEFNFLFHEIYKCAHDESSCDENYNSYYNFGNNARKFLESFLYYKYPYVSSDNCEKMKSFFGEDSLAISLTNRITNEYSHLSGTVEKSIIPIDVPEMKSLANFILKKIEEKDPDQYNSLLKSIGESK